MNIRQNGSKITAVCAIVLACTAFHVHAATLYVNGTNSTPSAPFTSWETAADLPNNWTPLQPEIQRPSTIHISQTAQGNDTGVDAVNAHSAAWFNTASNWNSSTDLTDGMIGPGDVVEFHGIITTRLTVQESGTAGDGNSIQITFADDAMMYVPTLPDNINIPERERTQLDLSYRDYITLMNVQFSPDIGQGDLPDTYALDTNGVSRAVQNTKPHFLIYIGNTSTYYGEPENIRVQNCSHNNAHYENKLTAVMLRFGNNILLEGNSFIGMQIGFDSAWWGSHNITLRNNSFVGYDDSRLNQSERYARLQDIIRVGAMNDVLIEGNYLSLRKWIADGEITGDRGAYHSDIIQTFRVNSGGSYHYPGNIILRYNRIESNCSPYIDRSWLMCANLTGYFYIYGNVFLGKSGASNGLRMQSDDPAFKAYVCNNTLIAKSGQGNIIAFCRSYDAAAAATEEYCLVNNIIYLTNDNMGVVYGNSGTLPLSFYRSNNVYFAEVQGGTGWAYAGSSRTQWLAGETDSQFIDPLFEDYDNDDFSLLSGSPAIDTGKMLDGAFLVGLEKGSTFPGPHVVERPSGLAMDIGAYEYYVIADTDGDGLPDWWETFCFGGATNARPDAICSNGINTLLEAYIAGLNPNDPQSRLLISDLRSLTSGNVLNWNAVTGRLYSVYWTTNLLNSFQPLYTNYTGGTVTDTVHGAEGKCFYKLDVRLQ